MNSWILRLPLYDKNYEFRGSTSSGGPSSATPNSTPVRNARKNSTDSGGSLNSSSTERPMTLELPKPLRSSLKKYNYTYTNNTNNTSPGGGGGSSRSGSTYSWGESGTLTNIETPPDSSLSEDSSYISAKDSSLTSVNSQVAPTSTHPSSTNHPPNRVRFSPITFVGSDRVETLLDMPVLDPTVPLQAYRTLNYSSSGGGSSSSNNHHRTEYSPKFRKSAGPNDYEKIEFLSNY